VNPNSEKENFVTKLSRDIIEKRAMGSKSKRILAFRTPSKNWYTSSCKLVDSAVGVAPSTVPIAYGHDDEDTSLEINESLSVSVNRNWPPLSEIYHLKFKG
jgi:hypothetical protein